MKTGIELIAEERERQISEEGWAPNHDDGHVNGELAKAAACYAQPEIVNHSRAQIRATCAYPGPDSLSWPFQSHEWKRSQDRIRNLVKAGALIAAEIDRLQRHSLAIMKQNECDC